MKKLCFILSTLIALTSLTSAQQQQNRSRENRPEGGRHQNGMILNMSKKHEELIKKFDKNGDGKLDETERKEAFAAIKKRSKDLKHMESQYVDNVIKKFDKDGDGKLNKPELQEYIKEQRRIYEDNDKHYNRREFVVSEELTKKFDKDGDGKLTFDEKKEVIAYLTAQKNELIKKYDTNKNNRIDPDEFQSLAKDPNYKGELKRFMPKQPFANDNNHKKNRPQRKQPKENISDNL